MIAFIKNLAPFFLYAGVIVLFFMAMTGRAKWTLLFVTAVLPLRNVAERLHPFPMGKDAIDILILAMLFGWILNTLLKGERLFENSPINVISIILIFYTYFSLCRGYAYLHSFTPFDLSDERLQDWKNFILLPILFFLTLNLVKDEKWIKRIFITMCVSMVLMNYYTFDQIKWFSGLVSRSKINGTFVYLGPNETAAFYNQFTIVLLAVYFFLRRSIPKFLLLSLILGNLYCVVFLFSRAAYLGLVAGLFFLFTVKKRWLLIPLFLLLIFWQVVLPEDVKTRILMTTDEYGQLETSAENRIIVWCQSMDLFKQNPILGVGFGVFRHLGFVLGDTHNIYLKILAEQGLIGFFIFAILIGVFFFEGLLLFKHGNDNLSKGLGLGFAICIVVLLINNMFGDRWSYLELSAYLWIFTGLVARFNAIRRTAYQAQAAMDHAKKQNPLYKIFLWRRSLD